MSKKAKINVVYFVVGDKRLNAGDGIYVKNLEEMKARLIDIKQASEWRLVISIHGSMEHLQDFAATSKDGNSIVLYDVEKIHNLFNKDKVFNEWREAFGPTWTTLNACQVYSNFESAIIKALNKPKSKQEAEGLGKDCMPLTTIWTYHDENGKPITTRDQFGKSKKMQLDKILDKNEREKRAKQLDDDLNTKLKKLNDEYGYFGAPPVPDPLLQQYYFDEAPKGGWPVVTVAVKKANTDISYYHRVQRNYGEFSKQCSQHMGPILRSRTSAVPPVGDI
jgi:hypothetical protein